MLILGYNNIFLFIMIYQIINHVLILVIFIYYFRLDGKKISH